MAARAILLSVALVAMAARAAEAQPAVAGSAQPHLEAALKAYEAKDYDVAIREFEQAYAIDPKPALLYATAQAYRFANRCAKALELYRRYLTAKLSDAQVAAAKTGISLCEAAIKQQDAAAAATKPEPAKPEPPAKAEPPKPEPVAKSAPVAQREPTMTVEPTPVQRDTPWYKDPLGDALTAGGVVGISVGVTFLVMANASESRAKSATVRTDFIRSLDEATQRRRIGWVSLGAGSALALGGVLVYLLRDRHAPRQLVGSDGRSLYISGAF